MMKTILSGILASRSLSIIIIENDRAS
uniref:Uncharacterized protein n=1 Tax=Arundo donax TaxID=35708 RepID=A0A0A9HHV1_ARUDO